MNARRPGPLLILTRQVRCSIRGSIGGDIGAMQKPQCPEKLNQIDNLTAFNDWNYKYSPDMFTPWYELLHVRGARPLHLIHVHKFRSVITVVSQRIEPPFWDLPRGKYPIATHVRNALFARSPFHFRELSDIGY
jgi:hypothetical protein